MPKVTPGKDNNWSELMRLAAKVAVDHLSRNKRRTIPAYIQGGTQKSIQNVEHLGQACSASA
jgi:hypothetical protein